MKIDSGMEITPETSSRKAVLTMRSPSSLLTGSCAANERPASPCSSPAAQVRYCTTLGWLRCSWSRRAARLAGVAPRPRIARAGSPGRAWVAAKTTIETSTSTSSPWRMRRTMNIQMPPVLAGPPVGPGRSSMAGPARGSTCSVVLCEPDVPEAMSEGVEVELRLAPLVKARDFRAVCIDQVVEHRDDVAALLVLELLHLVDEVGALAGIGLGESLLVEADVVRVLRRPVALVVRGRRDAAVRHLREIVSRAPEVDREGELEVGVAVVVGIVVDVDGDAGCFCLVREDVRRVDHAGRPVCRVQVDRQVFLAGLLQQRLRLGDVLVALRQ